MKKKLNKEDETLKCSGCGFIHKRNDREVTINANRCRKCGDEWFTVERNK